MSTSNRAALLTKTHRVLKKHFKPVTPPTDRSVLDHMLYACCLENSKADDVDVVLAKLEQSYFDWNEVRVTTVNELAEVMNSLSDPSDAATRLKRTLHSVFESQYSFELEHLKKQNLGAAVKSIEKLAGITPFTLAYMTQHALGGHAVPVNRGALEALVVVGVISPADAKQQRVPGLERAIPKSKGVEFGSLLHQLGVDYGNAPFSPRVRSILLEIAPDAKERMPKRSSKKAPEPAAEKKTTRRAAKKRAAKTKKSGAAAKKKSSTKRLSRKKPR